MENRSEILKELEEIAPELAKVEKKSTADVPADYFSSFSEVMLKKIQHQELAENALALARLEKENVLKVPADYFKTFPEQMLSRVSSANKQQATSASSWKQRLNRLLDVVGGVIFKPKYSFALAGTATMIVIGIMMIAKVEQCNDFDCKVASITDEELDTYLDNSADIYPDEVFEITFDEVSTSDQNLKETLKDVSDAELSSAILD